MISLSLALMVPDAHAQAACQVATVLQVPADDARATDAPRFSWNGNCTNYAIQLSRGPAMNPGTSVTSPLRPVRTWKPSDFRWSQMLGRGYTPDLYWRVIGVDANGNVTRSAVNRLETDWDDDLDGVSFRDGDCDDSDATVYPGATEILSDGIDQDCDGQDAGCVDCTLECTDDILSANVVYTGDNTGLADTIQTCVGSGGDSVVEFTAPTAGLWRFMTSNTDDGTGTSTGWDTTLSVQETCAGPELACNDDGGAGLHSLAFASLAANQTVAVVVTGFSEFAAGSFDLVAELAPALEDNCFDQIDNDGNGLEDCNDAQCAGGEGCIEICGNGADDDADFSPDCFDADCAGDPSCGAEVCTDGVDNDADFGTDCFDPDCDFDAACVEDCTDGIDNDGDFAIDCADGACAGDASCVEDCTNDLDDDFDGAVDCLDANCVGDAACVIASCPSGGTWTFGVPGMTNGTTTAGTNNWDGTPCGFSAGAFDASYEFTAPADGTYTFSTDGSDFDTILHVQDSCALAPTADCNDDAVGPLGFQSEVTVSLVMGEVVIVVVDGYNLSEGNYVLSVR